MNKVFFGDCRDTMRQLASEGVKVQTCVTSPPYFGLRDYGHPGQLGLDPTPDEYVSNMVEVFRCVRDLLADDGTLWLNLGDSYAGSANNGGTTSKTMQGTQAATGRNLPTKRGDGIKQKDLLGIPWRVAFALQADGWYLRQDIIWSKPNPMPESVTDRCTKAHEYIFLLSKGPRYYFDAEAIKEPSSKFEKEGPRPKTQPNGLRADDAKKLGGFQMQVTETRNRRSVWTVATRPYKGAHFATYPPELIEPCILAGAPAGGIVLDPFFGSGTTGQVCQQLDRQWIGCELNPAYEDLQLERTRQNGLEFA
jgi:DNA modification methylase